MDAESGVDFSLSLDLSKTGIVKVGKEDGVYFDLDNTGFAQRTAWVGGGAGFLALDLNGNGVIDNGGELFGDFTLLPDGSRAIDGLTRSEPLGAILALLSLSASNRKNRRYCFIKHFVLLPVIYVEKDITFRPAYAIFISRDFNAADPGCVIKP